MSTAFHPQTDGQTERANRTLEDMLQAFVNYRQDNWDQLLATAEFACNNAPNASTGMSPFHVNTGRDPHNPYTSITKIPDHTPAAAEFLEALTNATKIAADALALAKANQERNANKHRRHIEFTIGDQVLVSSNHINIASQAARPSKKLQHRFLGPFPIIQKISPVAYKLELPETLKIHPVFHVSLLRPYQNPSQFPDRPPTNLPPPPVTVNDIPEYEVEHILDHRTRRNQQEYLVKWVGYPDHDATWEPVGNLMHAAELLEEYLASRTMLEGGGSNVMESQVTSISRDQSGDLDQEGTATCREVTRTRQTTTTKPHDMCRDQESVL
jgi:hypothetical protein